MRKAEHTIYGFGSAPYAAKRAAEVVFVLQNKDRLGYAAVVAQLNAVLQTYGERAALTYADLDELKGVARELYAVFGAPDVPRAARLLNAILESYGHAPRLSCHGGTDWHLHVDRDDHASWAAWFASSSALALASLLAEKQQNPAGLCASTSCGRPFIDLGKGRPRSYCSPRCATRERVATYRKTRQTPAA